MNIAIFSNDNFLINYLNKTFENVLINEEKISYNTIVILDNVKKNVVASIIINISNESVEQAINIKPPFRLNDLKRRIEESIEYINNNVFSLNNCFVDRGKNMLIFNNRCIQLTAKEIELVSYLYYHKNSDKINILKNVWNIENIDNKSLETMIYNIKQKVNDDFIICNNGSYSIGEIK